MDELCHRCHLELPGSATDSQHSDREILFCPNCGAPQLLLQEHMRIEDPGRRDTTGIVPPPRIGTTNVREIDWRHALRCSSFVAVLAGVLTGVGLGVNALVLPGLCLLLSGGMLSLSLYARKRPRPHIDGKIGLRIGVVTGVLMLGALAIAGAGTGIVMRFKTQSLLRFDQQSAEQTKLAQAWGVRWLQQQNQEPEVQERYIRFVNSPTMTSAEMKAGTELAQLAFDGLLVMLVSAGGGALTGLLQRRRVAATRIQ